MYTLVTSFSNTFYKLDQVNDDVKTISNLKKAGYLF